VNPVESLKNKLSQLRLAWQEEPSGVFGILQHKALLLVLACLVLGALAAKPVFHRIVSWRAHSLAEQAMGQVEKQDFDGALKTLRTAYQLAPDNHEVVRALALALALTGNPAALKFWKAVIGFREATLDDRRQFLGLTLQSGTPSITAEEQLRLLLDKEPNSARNWLLAARLKELSGASEKALLCARKAHELDPAMEEATFFLASLLLRSPGSVPEGTDLLWTLVEGNGKNSLNAALFAAELPGLSRERAEALVKRLKSDPASKEKHRLRALELEIRLHPESRRDLLDAAMEPAANLDETSLCELGGWLNTHGEPERTLALVKPDQAKKSRARLLVYLDALAALNRWREVDAAISEKGIPLEPVIFELFKARCDTEFGHSDDALAHWRAAQTETIGHPEQAFFAAKYLRQVGRDGQAENIYRSFTGNNQTARAAFLELLDLAAPKGTAAVYGVLGEMRGRWPKDEQIQNDHTYFSLLLEKEAGPCLETARALVEAAPSSLAHRTILAFALLRLRKPAEALDVYSNLDIPWASQPVPYRVVFAAVLRANGRDNDAAAMISGIPDEAMRPEERALVNFSSNISPRIPE